MSVGSLTKDVPTQPRAALKPDAENHTTNVIELQAVCVPGSKTEKDQCRSISR